ncbi:MAG: RNA pseudouridine synthase, partial [Muribaculaceae bacterium]|nr:RNA pseudouridine synthase [Muribaculaceae bacterium]
MLNARGEYRSLSEIFATTALKVPPSGAGECCAPKLLQAAYLRGLTPVAMAEYWYGAPKGGEVRRHGEHYPACRGKCLPVLGWMLQGLEIEPPLSEECRSSTVKDPEILSENRWFCVVDKPSGMLSVPGKGSTVSVQRWLEERYGAEREVKVVHRLDQDTSGLLLAAFGPEAFRLMQKMFAMRKVRKTYVAELEGNFNRRGIAREGRIKLPLSADW